MSSADKGNAGPDVERLKKSTNFIDQYEGAIIEDIPDVNPEWAEGVATGVLSTGVGSSKTTHTRVGPLHLNVWHLYIAPSGTVKTLPLHYFAEPTIEALSGLLNEEAGLTDEGEEGKKKKPLFDLMLPRTFSLESLLTIMKGRTAQGLIAVDEVTGAFKEAATKSYMADLYENWSLMYDCATVRASFVKWGAYKPIRDPYVTALLCGVPTVYQYLPADYSVQGTANRILPIVGEGTPPEDEYDVDAYFSEQPLQAEDERDKKLTQFATWLLRIRNSPVRIISNSTGNDESQSGAILLKNKRAINAEFRKVESEVLRGYLRRMNEMTLKLAALRRLGGLAVGSGVDVPTPEEARWATGKVWRHYEHYKVFVKRWGGGASFYRDVPATSHKSVQEKIRSMIREAGGKLDRSTVLIATGVDAEELTKIVNGMPDIEATYGESGPQGGRRAILYSFRQQRG